MNYRALLQPILAEHRRGYIVAILRDLPRNTANDAIMADVVNRLGVPTSRDTMRVELAWLEEQGLITTLVDEGLIVATLTERGNDCADGRAMVPGVRRHAG